MRDIEKEAEKAAELLKDRLPAMVLTGAGVSVESNIPPFRGKGGLWDRYDPYIYGHIETFIENPGRSWEMLTEIIDGSIDAQPNEAHLSLSRMEEKGWVGPVVTQNVDGLHLLSGSMDVLEVHGNARRIYCMQCGWKGEISRENWKDTSPRCDCGAWRRPDIVFFGESLPDKAFKRALAVSFSSRALIVVGTSGVVYPVAAIPDNVKRAGGIVIEVNSAPSSFTDRITDVFLEVPATKGIPAIEKALERLLS